MSQDEAPEYYEDDIIQDQPDEPEDEIEATDQETADAEDKYFDRD